MFAIVITLGGYFAALNWLVRPPDPWQSSAGITTGTAQHVAARKRPPAVKPAEAAESPPTLPAEPDRRLASVEPPATVAAVEHETAPSAGPAVALVPRPAETTRAVVETAHATRRDLSATKTRAGKRKRVARNTSRKLELMVLRTYERSDGKRFTRLLPMSSARNAMAFQLDDPW
jgi:type IV secretory pathway VirB10-like protein